MSEPADNTGSTGAAARPEPAYDIPDPVVEQPGLAERFAALRRERPEVIVVGAFVGGVVLAMVFKRMASR